MKCTIEHMERLYAEGYSARVIGQAIGFSRTWVTDRLHDAGVQLRPSGGSPKRENASYDPLIRELYVDYGYSTREIGEELSWSKTFVRRRLIEMGVKRRPRGGNQRRIAFQGTSAKHLYVNERLSLDEVAKRLGTTRNTVMKWLDLMNVERPKGGQAVKRARSGDPSPDLRRADDDGVAADGGGRPRRPASRDRSRRGGVPDRGARVLAGVAADEGHGDG